MERRLFLTTLFKGVVASTIAYSLPIVGQEFSEVHEVVSARDMRIPMIIRPGGYLTDDIIALELNRMRPMMATLFDLDDTFFKQLEKELEKGKE